MTYVPFYDVSSFNQYNTLEITSQNIEWHRVISIPIGFQFPHRIFLTTEDTGFHRKPSELLLQIWRTAQNHRRTAMKSRLCEHCRQKGCGKLRAVPPRHGPHTAQVVSRSTEDCHTEVGAPQEVTFVPLIAAPNTRRHGIDC